MSVVDLVMPKMGESIMEGTILKWLKKVGEPIAQDESFLEVATDKVDTEVPATHAGILVKILAQEGQVVAVGAPIARVETEAKAGEPHVPAAPSQVKPAEAQASQPATNGKGHHADASMASAYKLMEAPVAGRFYSPLVLSMAKEEQIDMATLEKIPGSGKDQRVTKADILQYLDARKGGALDQQAVQAAPAPAPAKVSAPASASALAPSPAVAAGIVSGQDEIIEMDRMRKIIAQRMVDSKRTSPHVTSFVEADVTGLVNWRNKAKNEFQKKYGDVLTFTPMFVEAVVKALRDYPMMNVQVDGERIIKKRAIGISLAVALPSGNLIVPVIQNADQLNLVGLSLKVNDLARRARENKLTPDDLSGGTFTVSNVGSFGNVMGTPIINQPQVGILALGAIQKKVAVIEGPGGGDMIAIRHRMFLSHSYDHRVVDGALGGMFVRRVADYLEQFDASRPL